MITDQKQLHLETLKDLAENRRCAELYYGTRLTPARAIPRLVEPYALLQGTQDVLVRCYQLTPDEGWRTFMLHKIERVVDTGIPFRPRHEITIGGDETPIFGADAAAPRAPWTPDLQMYRDLVAEALRGGLVDEQKLSEIRDFAARAGLPPERVRWVHALLFQRALSGVIRDGEVADRQLDELRLVQRVLTGLGWGVTNTPARPRRHIAPQRRPGEHPRAVA